MPLAAPTPFFLFCVYAPCKRGLHAVAARVCVIVGMAKGVPAAPFTKRSEVG